MLANLDSQIEIIMNRMRTSHTKREPHRNPISLYHLVGSERISESYNFTQHNVSLPYRNMQARDSPAFAAQRQVFRSQAPSIQPLPMEEATTGPSHQNTTHPQGSQSALIPPYQAPFVPFTYGMPPTFSQAYNFQYPSTLRQILPKPQVMADSQ